MDIDDGSLFFFFFFLLFFFFFFFFLLFLFLFLFSIPSSLVILYYLHTEGAFAWTGVGYRLTVL